MGNSFEDRNDPPAGAQRITRRTLLETAAWAGAGAVMMTGAGGRPAMGVALRRAFCM